jgi:hypothetical protein
VTSEYPMSGGPRRSSVPTRLRTSGMEKETTVRNWPLYISMMNLNFYTINCNNSIL